MQKPSAQPRANVFVLRPLSSPVCSKLPLIRRQIMSHKRDLPGHKLRHSAAAALLARGFDIKIFGTGAAAPLGSVLQALAEFR